MAELVDRGESFSFCISDLSRGGKKATLVEHVRKFWKNYRQLWSWILYPSSENFPNDLCKKWCTEGEHLFEKRVVKESERGGGRDREKGRRFKGGKTYRARNSRRRGDGDLKWEYLKKMGWRGRAEERERRDSRKGDIYKKGIQEERAFKVTEIEWRRASKELIKRKERPSEHSVTKMVASF